MTCGFTCKERLYNEGGDPTMCNVRDATLTLRNSEPLFLINICPKYCYQHPRLPGEEQCSDACAALAREACLLCRCRPRNGFYHLCGNRCKEIVASSGILILEVVKGHSTFSMGESLFPCHNAGSMICDFQWKISFRRPGSRVELRLQSKMCSG